MDDGFLLQSVEALGDCKHIVSERFGTSLLSRD